DPGGAEWRYSYDLLGNRLAASDPDLGYWSYTYDKSNQLITQRDARGWITSMDYDQLGRLTLQEVKASGGTVTTLVAKNTYDNSVTGSYGIGKLTTSENGTSSHRYYYEGNGLLATKSTTIDGVTNINYDKRSTGSTQIVWKQYYPDLSIGATDNRWQYNSNNMLKLVPGQIQNIAYEADGQTKSITYANGVTTTFTYDPERRWLTNIKTAKPTAGWMNNTYERDAVGRITKITSSVPTENWTYTYDTLSRLKTAVNAGTSALNEGYTYSPSGNLLTRSKNAAYTYPAGTAVRPHAVTAIGIRTMTYDANGNMLTDGVRTHTWDPSNRLSKVVRGGTTVDIAYCPDGTRVSKSWNNGETLYPDAD
ncbi:MAG: hypothetical protein O7C56_05090, partial [Rickettsia endosymbiont of Ixodes persulcatus]|nr:hypothetical protein [Rickettsia endosymbiont of Ixodes persulcatus]